MQVLIDLIRSEKVCFESQTINFRIPPCCQQPLLAVGSHDLVPVGMTCHISEYGYISEDLMRISYKYLESFSKSWSVFFEGKVGNFEQIFILCLN